MFPAPFAGVFICDDETGNALLRSMEPPAHDKWDPERNKDRGQEITDELISWIRGCLSSMKQLKQGGVLEIPELQKYLPYEDGNEEGA